jgi:F-type H+-transporting ATPase subunit b
MEKLGIDTNLIVVQIVNFVLLLIILKKVMYKPVIEAIKKRSELLHDIDARSIKLDENIKSFDLESQKKLKAIQSEKKSIITEAQSLAERKSKAIVAEANDKAKDIIKNATLQAEKERSKLELEIEKRAKVIATAMIESTLSKSLTEKVQKETIAHALSVLKELDAKDVN